MNVLLFFAYTEQRYPGIEGKMIKMKERQEAVHSPESVGCQLLRQEHCAKESLENERNIPGSGIDEQDVEQLMSRSETSGSEELLEQTAGSVEKLASSVCRIISTYPDGEPEECKVHVTTLNEFWLNAKQDSFP